MKRCTTERESSSHLFFFLSLRATKRPRHSRQDWRFNLRILHSPTSVAHCSPEIRVRPLSTPAQKATLKNAEIPSSRTTAPDYLYRSRVHLKSKFTLKTFIANLSPGLKKKKKKKKRKNYQDIKTRNISVSLVPFNSFPFQRCRIFLSFFFFFFFFWKYFYTSFFLPCNL